jgi:phosphate transport system substrate-binding protein
MPFNRKETPVRRLTRTLAFVTAAAALLVASAGYSAAAPSHTQITGTGSSWAANAVTQWISDVAKQGLQIVFTSTGSAQGRKDFAFKNTDFGVSDIAYQGRDPVSGTADTSNGRKFVYLPVVAGGTSFPYHLTYAGKQIRNLRLSGETIAKIFTDKITKWNDPEIAADNNNQLHLPDEKIIPTVHSEGSGSTYQFTAYLAKQYHSIWAGYNPSYTGATEYWPTHGYHQAPNGSDGVINFITSSAGEGSIGFDEYSYALGAGFPVAKVLNAAGYYTAPTQYNVAVALTQAQIQDKNPAAQDYLTQKLDNVYGYNKPQVYPLSSYSYMIIPTGTNATETKTSSTAQRQTIADFLYYSICQGQAEMGPIGYSPLPVNLVQDGFGQIAKLKAADKNVDLTQRNVTTCHNPTFIAGHPTENHLAQIAPVPPACDKQGAGPCAAGVGVAIANPDSHGKPPSSGGGDSSGPATGGPSGHASAGAPAANGRGTPTAGSSQSAAAAAPSVDPNTGQLVTNNGGGGSNPDLVGAESNLPNGQSSQAFNSVMYVLAILLLLMVIVGPVAFSRYLAHRRAGS